MPDAALASRSAFAGLELGGGRDFTVTERTGLGLATVAARRGGRDELEARLRSGFGLELRDGSAVSAGERAIGVGIGPGNWLVVAEGGGSAFARELATVLAGAASVCDQSSGYGVLRLGGPATRRVLAKGVPVDLHPSRFRPGDAAVTLASHVGIVLWQVDEAPTYDVAVFRSYAGSFAHWLAESAAEFR